MDRPRPARPRARSALPALGLAVLLGLAGCTGGDATDTTGATTTSPTPAGTAGATGSADGGGAGTGTGTAGGGGDGGAGPDDAGAGDVTGSSGDTPSELAPVAPPDETAHPAAVVPGPSLTGALPPADAARGERLVGGFPVQVVPVPDGVRVVSSSVSPDGQRLQVGLEASGDAEPAAVQDAYVQELAAAGFAVSPAPATPGSTATAFTRGPDGLVLTVRPRTGGGTELTLAGTLTTAG
ncbi:hypothetical protein [Cellulomonas telluris]|uniref:hypothetical protein n=1 Tax=Cellulomonas telluris TaxID=2306636 RepID=UPI0010A7BC09|nr:hypothetical protein [Cellulomonas telluris]